MKLGRFIKGIIRADANYFLRNSFIPREEHRRVMACLGGTSDAETQAKIASWLEADGDYIEQLGDEACRFFWYLWPAAWIIKRGLIAICNKYANGLKESKIS